MSQTQPESDGDVFDQTFTVTSGPARNGCVPQDEIRIVLAADQTPRNEHTHEIAVDEIHVCARRLSGTLEVQYPELGAGSRDEGRYLLRFDTPLQQYTTDHGDYVMGAATAVEIPTEVGDTICEYFGLDTLSERKQEVVMDSLLAQARTRLEHDDDFRERIELILEQTK